MANVHGGRRGSYLAGAGWVLLGLITCSCALLFPRVAVTVTNETDAAVTSLTIEYNGGSKVIGDLAAGASESFSIRAQGDSDLHVSFDQNGEHHDVRVDTYFHSESYGEIRLFIESGGFVREIDDLG